MPRKGDIRETKSDYDDFLASLRAATGIEAFAADEDALASVRVDDRYNLNLQFVEATGKILCFVEMATVPADASADVFRDLLAGGLFGKDTAGGFFALEPVTGTVVYNYYFDAEKAGADIDGFVATLEKILQLCDIWAERIRRDLEGEEPEDGDPTETRPHQMILA